MDRAAVNFATMAIACSGAVRDFYEEELHYPAAKLAVIHNSVDMQRFRMLSSRGEARQRLNIPQDALILVCVASLTEQKGHCYLLEAIYEVSSAFPDTLLLLVGDGDLRPQLEQGARQKLLNGTVHFLGWRMDIPLILAACDLFVLPSLWEGLPLVLAEAGAAGLLVVATNVDGIPEVIDNGSTGLLVPPRSSELLAEAILTLLRNSERRIEMGKKAHQLIHERFSITRIARDVESRYLKLLNGRDRRTRRSESCWGAYFEKMLGGILLTSLLHL